MTEMDSSNDRVLPILRSFCKLELNSFDDRMKLQKLAHLIQKMSKKSDYGFSWYLRGPYSSGLTSALFMHEELGTYQNKQRLNTSDKSTTSRITELLNGNFTPLELELYASLWYLLPSRKPTVNDKNEILKIMCKEKPHFQKKEINTALHKIIKFKEKYCL